MLYLLVGFFFKPKHFTFLNAQWKAYLKFSWYHINCKSYFWHQIPELKCKSSPESHCLALSPLLGPCYKFPRFTGSRQDSQPLLFPLQFCQLPGFWKPVSWKASCHHVVPVPLWVVQKLRVHGLPPDVLNFSCSVLEEMILEKNQPNTPPDKN